VHGRRRSAPGPGLPRRRSAIGAGRRPVREVERGGAAVGEPTRSAPAVTLTSDTERRRR